MVTTLFPDTRHAMPEYFKLDITKFAWHLSVYEVALNQHSELDCFDLCHEAGDKCTMTLHFNDTCYLSKLGETHYDVLAASPHPSITTGKVKKRKCQ